MKKLFLFIALLAISGSVVAQITDETLIEWFNAKPTLRVELAEARPDLFKLVTLDSTFADYYWKEYHVGSEATGVRYYLVQKVAGVYYAIIEVGPNATCYTRVNIGEDTPYFISPYIQNGVLPAHDQNLVDWLDSRE